MVVKRKVIWTREAKKQVDLILGYIVENWGEKGQLHFWIHFINLNVLFVVSRSHTENPNNWKNVDWVIYTNTSLQSTRCLINQLRF